MSSFESWMGAFSRYDYIPVLLILATIVFQVVYYTKTRKINGRYKNFKGCSIDKVEHRGITINQLLFIQDEIKARCVPEGWKDKDGNLLTPERVNLYDIKYKIIIDRTSALQCSYVELVAIADQFPEWFVSHWWGESVFAFIKCLIRHAKDRGLSWDTPYWICAYANNQHPGKIEKEMVGNPFLEAMKISRGTVSILDKDCVVYSRIWCIYELYKSLMDKKIGYKFDVYTEHDWELNHIVTNGSFIDNSDAIGLIDGFIDGDVQYVSHNPVFKGLRESHFPLQRILKASAIDIKKAVATETRDEKYIKNTITNQNEDDDPPEHHDNYEKLNNLIHGFFVSSSLERILKDESIESDQKSIYFDILKQSSATVIYLNMSGYTSFDDSIATQLAESLPPTITSFTFRSDGSIVTQHGIRTIFRGLANLTNLEKLVLDNNSIDDETCSILADAIRKHRNNNSIRLRNNKIGDEGVKAISNALIDKNNQNRLEILNLKNNQISVEGAIAIAAVLSIKNTLKTLTLGGNEISDKGAIAIAAVLRINKTLNSLDLSKNKVGDEGVKELADALLTNQCLEKLYLGGNEISDEGAIEIAAALRINKSLNLLSLNGNLTGDKEAIAIVIAAVLGINKSLKILRLTKNKVGDEGVKELADALSTNHCLEELYLGGNGISDEGAIAIAAVLRTNKSLKKLFLEVNNIGDKGVKALADALSTNGSLKHLDLEHNSEISEQTMQYITSTMKKRNNM